MHNETRACFHNYNYYCCISELQTVVYNVHTAVVAVRIEQLLLFMNDSHPLLGMGGVPEGVAIVPCVGAVGHTFHDAH